MAIDLDCRARLASLPHRRFLCDYINDKEGYIIKGERRLLSFCSNDYLNLSAHPSVCEAAIAAIRHYGLGGQASRLVVGNNLLYSALEAKLASYAATEAALVFGCGFLANYSVVSTLLTNTDLLLVDRNIHASVLEGRGRANILRFSHNSLDSCKLILSKNRHNFKRCIIYVESVYSMDGDTAPLEDFWLLSKEYDCWLAVDHAHSLEIHHKYSADIKIGTLSKVLGGYGGYVCSSQGLIDLLVNKAKSLVYSTALPPAVLGGAIAALDVLESLAENRSRPIDLARLFCSNLGLPVPASQIVPLKFRDAAMALEAAKSLEEAGFLVVAIRPPTVITSLLRFAFSACHSEDQVNSLCQIVARLDFIRD